MTTLQTNGKWMVSVRAVYKSFIVLMSLRNIFYMGFIYSKNLSRK